MVPVPDGSPARLALGTLVTERLRVLLERRAIRMVVVGSLLAMAVLFTYLPGWAAEDSEWLFIVPVAISAIAAGLREGLLTALLAAALSGLWTTDDATFQLNQTLIANVLSARFALYGITATVLGAFAEAHYSVQDHLRQLASLDPLTKVSNIERFHHEVRLMDVAGLPDAVLLADVDNLKALNDVHGHQTGSAAIQTVANVLRRVVRTSDLVARFGGDEFVVILRDADRVGAQIVMNRVCDELATERLVLAPTVDLQVSMGVAIAGEDGTTPEELLAAADAAMYAEKRKRKAGDEPPTELPAPA